VVVSWSWSWSWSWSSNVPSLLGVRSFFTASGRSCAELEVVINGRMVDELGIDAASLMAEFEGLDLKDARRERRVLQTLDALAANPAASLRAAARSEAEAEAMYGLLRNEKVSFEQLTAPPIANTALRVKACVGPVLVLHDTSEFSYQGKTRRAGLGKLRTADDQGFLLHASLAVTAAGEPLGVLGLKTWVRTAESTSRRNGKKRNGADYAQETDKESNRWLEQIQQTRKTVGSHELIHIADREADAYPLLASLQDSGDRFVIRLARDRVIREHSEAAPEKIRTALARTEGLFVVEVPVSARKPTSIPGHDKTFGYRAARRAKLEFSACRVQLRRPAYVQQGPAWLDVNVVHVRELDAPDAEAIEWILLTSEPIETAQQILSVVHFYRARWLIEEYFKALKTGCAMEDRELESLRTLTNILALFVPIAVQMLRLRFVARAEPERPARDVLTPTQLLILQIMRGLALDATVSQALWAVAQLGGHWLTRKPPGWIVLARGMQKLIAMAAAVDAVRNFRPAGEQEM